MEPAKIDWKRIESVFVEDNVYEHINAPTWVDFLDPQDSVDDQAWFCRPDCKHPKTADDFFKSPAPTSKQPNRNASTTERLPLGERNQRLKRRGQSQTSFANENYKVNEESENQNPNLTTTPPNRLKAMIKSSTEKKKPNDDTLLQNNETPGLKRTLSARNLFGGKEIISHISEFCNELKKLTMRAKEGENLNEKKEEVVVKKEEEGSCEFDGREKERKPLLNHVSQEKFQGVEKGSANEKLRRIKRFDEAENIPISLNMENVKHKGEERLLQIRTNPPSPQCFSGTRAPTKTTPSKASRSRLMERGILQEVKQNEEVTKEEPTDKGRSVSIVDGREARGLDVFWFLKPCTLSGLNG